MEGVLKIILMLAFVHGRAVACLGYCFC